MYNFFYFTLHKIIMNLDQNFYNLFYKLIKNIIINKLYIWIFLILIIIKPRINNFILTLIFIKSKHYYTLFKLIYLNFQFYIVFDNINLIILSNILKKKKFMNHLNISIFLYNLLLFNKFNHIYRLKILFLINCLLYHIINRIIITQ